MPSLVGSNKWFGASSVSSRPGPYRYGTSLFGVVYDTDTGTLQVVRSTNGGASWTEADSANHVAAPDYSSFGCSVWGNVLYIAHAKPGADSDHLAVALSTFDMATAAWLGTSTSTLQTFQFPYDINVFYTGILVAARGADDCVVGFGNITGGKSVVYGALWNGSWGSPFQVSDGVNGCFILSMTAAASGVLFAYQTVNTSKQVRLRTLDATNTLGSTVVLVADYVEDIGQGYTARLVDASGNLITPSISTDGNQTIGVTTGPEAGPFTRTDRGVNAPTTLRGYQVSWADIEASDPDNGTLIWMPDQGDFSTLVQYAKLESGVWAPAQTLYTASGPNERIADVFIERDPSVGTTKHIFFRTADSYVYCVPSRDNSLVYYDSLQSDAEITPGPAEIILDPGTPEIGQVLQPGPAEIILTPGTPEVQQTCVPGFTLMKITVTMRPATHLPVRGSSH